MNSIFSAFSAVLESANYLIIYSQATLRKVSLFIRGLFEFKFNKPIEQKKFSDFIININSPNDNFVYHEKYPLCNVMLEGFIPKEGVQINLVRDDNTTVWEGEDPLQLALVAHKDGRPYMISVDSDKAQSRYFIKSDDRWTEISFDEFESSLIALRLSVKIRDRFTINGDNPFGTERLATHQHKLGDTNQVMFFPRVCYEAKAFAAGDQIVWRAENDDQRCLLATVFHYWYYTILCSIAISSDPQYSHESVKILYFKKEKDWVKIERDEYLAIAESNAPWFSCFQTIDLQEMLKQLNA